MPALKAAEATVQFLQTSNHIDVTNTLNKLNSVEEDVHATIWPRLHADQHLFRHWIAANHG